jgi:CHAT domain-containing protein
MGLFQQPGRGLMRTHTLVSILIIGVLLILSPIPRAEAQRGMGQGRGRPMEPPSSGTSTGSGTYSLNGPDVLDVVNRGEGSRALAYYERAATELERQGDDLQAALAGHAVSMVAFRLGRYQLAIQSAAHALELFKRARVLRPSDQMNWASTFSNLGAAYRVVGDFPKARQALEEGLAFTARLSWKQAGAAEGVMLTELAMVALAQGDYRTALARASQAAQFFDSAELRLRPEAKQRRRTNIRRWAANSYVQVGRAELMLGNLDKAAAAFARGLSYAKLSGLPEIEMQVLSAQAWLALQRQEWSKALTLYRECITLANQTQRVSALPHLYHGQARALAGLGQTDDALASSREAVRRIEEQRADLGDPGLRSGFFEDKQGMYQLAVHLALQAQHPEEAFSFAERARSRAFLDLLGSQTTLSKGRTRALVDEEVRLRTRLAEAKAHAQDSGELADSEPAQALIEALDQDYRAFLDRVRKESLEQASLMAVEPVTLSEIQALLPAGTTLLEYVVADRGLIIWAVDRQRFKVVRLPGDRQSLVAQVRQFRTAITGLADLKDVQTQAEALHRRLLGAVRADIHGSRLLIVPHGVLHYLPFAALRSPQGHWLIEDFAMSTLPSASVLRYLAAKGTGAPPQALVVGNPDLGAALALPWAEREARMVGERERDATVLVRGDATEAQAKKLLLSAGLVHLATHGELNESDPLGSALLMVPGGGEDGRLEVREVFGLDLRARLVVLSACETGLGKLSNGDELVGLQRAFLYAGTPAVVTTLWKVDDRATYELVRAFYAKLDGADPVEALRHAQRETQRAFPHPFHWAAFSLAGVAP